MLQGQLLSCMLVSTLFVACDETVALLTLAIWIPVARCDFPEIFFFVLCKPSKSFPRSVVRVERTSGPLPPMLIRPTDDSGFPCVMESNKMLIESAWESNRVGW